MSGFLIFVLALTAWSAIVWLTSLRFQNRFAGVPGFWLAAIGLCFAPFLLAAVWLTLQPDAVPHVIVAAAFPVAEFSRDTAAALPSFWTLIAWAYIAIAVIAIGSLLRAYIALVRAARGQSAIAYIAPDQSAATLAWPHRKILMPRGLKPAQEALLLAHERAHLARRDPELTLGLCVLSRALWVNRPLAALIEAWRFAIELRADEIALAGTPPATRQHYARLLLDTLKTCRKGARPCPSAALIPDQKRRTEMRLKTILTPTAPMRKSKRAIAGLALAATALMSVGTLGIAAANGASPDRDAKPIKRVPPMMPANCESDTPIVKINREKNTAYSEGYANLIFDVDTQGVPQNIRITKSTAKCFEQPSIDSVRQWRYEPKMSGGLPVIRRGIENRVSYRQTVEFEGDVKISPEGQEPIEIEADSVTRTRKTRID